MVWGRTGGVFLGHGGLGSGKGHKQRRGLQSNLLPGFFSSQTEVTSLNLFVQLKHFASRSKSPTLGSHPCGPRELPKGSLAPPRGEWFYHTGEQRRLA